MNTHPPGHPTAVIYGCTCPTVENNDGMGSGEYDGAGCRLYFFDLACPMHKGHPMIRAHDPCAFDPAWRPS